jgi:tRNA A37 methylthiotransferase MiaB
MIAEGSDVRWATGDLRPGGVTPAFVRLLQESGCCSVNLAVESASAVMLRNLGRGYRVGQVRAALDALSGSDLPWGASLMLGGPGETPATIADTLGVVGDYHVPQGVWVTVGVYQWTDLQDVTAAACRDGSVDRRDLFSGSVYLSPDLPSSYLAELPEVIGAREGYTLQFNKPDEDWVLPQR